MKKILLCLIALVAGLCANAQILKVYSGKEEKARYTSQEVDKLVFKGLPVYQKFCGQWILTGKDSEDNNVVKNITISTNFSGQEPVENVLWISAPSLFNVGVLIDCLWPIRVTYDEVTKSGTISHLMNQNVVASYGTAYEWVFMTDDGSNLTADPVEAVWRLGDDGNVPDEISWGAEKTIYLYQPGAGYWDCLYDIKITRK